MQKAPKILRWVLSAATVGLVLILCQQCLAVYLAGKQSEDILSGCYSAEIVSARLSALAPLFILYTVIAAMTIIVNLFSKEKIKRSPVKAKFSPPRAQSEKTRSIVRIAVLCLGVLFIILGVTNGGARDVLVKAINICTECIGLG